MVSRTYFSFSSSGASRIRKDWLEEREKDDVNYDSIIKPSVQDEDLFAESVLPLINLILKLEYDELLPTNEEVRALVVDRDKEQVNWPTTIPQEYGARKLVVPANDPLTGGDIIAVTNVPPDSDAGASEMKQQFATNYEANNATIDCPMNMDLAADETVKSLMNYTASLGMTALNTHSNEEDDVDGAEPIMGSFGVPLLGNGNPSWTINKII